jgi:hypothetical protein
MTKGIAQRLCEGSARLDVMENQIAITTRIIHGQFKALIEGGVKFTFLYESERKVTSPFVSESFEWKIFVNDQKQLVVKCHHVHNVLLVGLDFRDIIVMDNAHSNIGSIRAADIQDVHSTLDGFISAVFDQFPHMKTRLAPLLDAGA